MTNKSAANDVPARFDKCILHIGTEKTGTTAIQHYLIEQRDRLLKQGIFYPKSINQGYTSQWEFVAAVHHNPWKQDVGRAFGINSPSDQAKFRKKLQEMLEIEFGSALNAKTLLISSEHFQSRLRTAESIEALKRFLSPWVNNFEIVIYFRRQDRCAISLLSTHLKSSVDLPRSDPLNLLNRTPQFYQYDEIYRIWAGVFGKSAMRPQVYDPICWKKQDLVSDFCELTGLASPKGNADIVNTSLNGKGFRFLRGLNRRCPATPGDRSDVSRSMLVKAVSTVYAGKYYPISRQQAIAFMSQFEDTNERLRQLAFPDTPAPLFGDDFSDFPEHPEPLDADYDEAIEVAMAVWRHVDESNNKRTSLIRRLSRRLSKRREG